MSCMRRVKYGKWSSVGDGGDILYVLMNEVYLWSVCHLPQKSGTTCQKQVHRCEFLSLIWKEKEYSKGEVESLPGRRKV